MPTESLAELVALVRALEALEPWWRGSATPLSEGEVTDFEADARVSLPHAYRGVLRTIGDRAPLPTRAGGTLLPLRSWRDDSPICGALGPLDAPFPHSGREEVSLTWDDVADDYDDPLWLRGALPLASGGCDLCDVLVVSGPDRGKVWLASPCGLPELHPTGLDFEAWYGAELTVSVVEARARVAVLVALERRIAADPSDHEAALGLARGHLFDDRPRVRALVDGAWSHARGGFPGLARVTAELDLLDGRHDRVDHLALLDPPWGRVYAAIAASRRGDDRRAIELFAAGPGPAILSELSAGYHALALGRRGLVREALTALSGGAVSPGNLALAARLRARLGDYDGAQLLFYRLRAGARAAASRPQAPSVKDALRLPRPSAAEIEAALTALRRRASRRRRSE